ncbi:MAG: germination protein YpeB [Candidatus Limiplasma sp.]|nr:germination protein YpeB [Candidatus Limiplasma sp.]
MKFFQSKRHVILYSFLSVALLAAVFLGVSFGLRAHASAQALEDVYTQRILETQEQLQAIALKLEKVPVSSDSQVLCELLTGISKQGDGVVTNLSALPLSHVAMSDTIKFCNQLSDLTLGLALTLAGGGELDQEQYKQLADMQSQCTLLLGQFVLAREAMLENSMKIGVPEKVYYQEAQASDRPLEQVGNKDNGMEYPTMIYDGAFSDARHYGTPKALGTESINQAQAQEVAIQFLGAQRVKEAAPSAETQGNLAAYGVTVTLTDGVQLTAEVTKVGGKLLWIVPEHASFEQKLSLEECIEAGLKFLREHGYGAMEANHHQVYDGMAVINFVAVQDGVLLYPDLVKLQLRMDTGEVVGLEANNYLMNHTQREGLTPALTADEALAHLSKNLTLEASRLCLIPFRDSERLCYEASGTFADNRYLIYLDANTAQEVQVLMVLQTPDGELSA